MKSNSKLAALILGLSVASPALADDFLSVCDRTAGYNEFLVETLAKPCDQISLADLATVKRVDVENTELAAFDPRDIDNLPNLEILNLNGNPFTALPNRAFVTVPNLKTLVLIRIGLTGLPNDFLVANPKIENLIIYKDAFTSIPQPILQRIEALPYLKVLQMPVNLEQAEKEQLQAKFPAGGAVTLQFR